MTRKHFEAIAGSLNNFWIEIPPDSKLEEYFNWLVNDLAAEFETMNQRFDRARFISAVYED